MFIFCGSSVVPHYPQTCGEQPGWTTHGELLKTRQQAQQQEVVDWLSFHNSNRLHRTLGYVSPMNYEKTWSAAEVRKSAQRSPLGGTSNKGKVRCMY